MRKIRLAAGCAAAALLLPGCTTPIATSPETFSLEPGHVSQLRPKQAVTLKNAFTAESSFPVQLKGGNTWVFDQKQMTETAITMLQRGLEKQDIRAAPDAPKTVTLRAHTPRATLVNMIAIVQVWATVNIDAEFGDGTRTTVRAENQSPAGGPRAFDGALLFALNKLVADEKFLAYMNKQGP